MSATDLTGPCTSGQSFASTRFCLFVWFDCLWTEWHRVCVFEEEERKTHRSCYWTDGPSATLDLRPREKSMLITSKQKEIINMEEHKIALHQCRILINRCFVVGCWCFFLPSFSPTVTIYAFLERKADCEDSKSSCLLFFLSFSHAPPLPPKHTSTVCSSSSLLVFLLIIFSPDVPHGSGSSVW